MRCKRKRLVSVTSVFRLYDADYHFVEVYFLVVTDVSYCHPSVTYIIG